MDLSQLPKLGKVAGVPGIALGVAALLLGAVVAATGILAEAWRGPVTVIVVVGAVLLGVLAVLGWMRGSRAGAQIARTEGGHSPAENLDTSKTGGSQHASSTGAHSPVKNVRK